MSKVSVIIPAFNYGRYLPEALGSVLTQTHRDIECIVVDDGSTDATAEIVRGWQQRDGRIGYIYQENRGPSAARNGGLRIARGEFIQFLDADDVLLPTKFEAQLAEFTKDASLGVSYCKAESFADGDPAGSRAPYWGSPSFDDENALYELLSRWAKSIAIASFCFLYRRRYIEGLYFDEGLRVDEDWDWLLGVAARGVRFRYVDKVLALHRKHPDSLTCNELRWRRHRLAVLQKLASTPGPWDEYRDRMDRLGGEAHYHLGLALLTDRKQSEARSHLRVGLGNGTKKIALLSLIGLSLSRVAPPQPAASIIRKLERASYTVRPGSVGHRMLKGLGSLGIRTVKPYARRHALAHERPSAAE